MRAFYSLASLHYLHVPTLTQYFMILILLHPNSFPLHPLDLVSHESHSGFFSSNGFSPNTILTTLSYSSLRVLSACIYARCGRRRQFLDSSAVTIVRGHRCAGALWLFSCTTCLIIQIHPHPLLTPETFITRYGTKHVGRRPMRFGCWGKQPRIHPSSFSPFVV